MENNIKNNNVMLSYKIQKEFAELFISIPEDIKNTLFFIKVQKLNKINLKYEEVAWIIEDFGFKHSINSWSDILDFNRSENILYKYIFEIVVSSSIGKREKLVVLLAHIEILIYKILKLSKKANIGLKSAVKRVAIDKNVGMSAENLAKIYILAVTYIVFANTDSYTDIIDKRIPFRNHILHNGIIMYSDENIDVAYELLVGLIEILVHIENRIHSIV